MKPLAASNLFVAGTDTGVGKTLVTSLLALKLRASGIDAGVMKPFASGCDLVDGQLVSEDAVILRSITGIEDPLELINPIRLEEPLAPLMAARRAGIDTSNWKSTVRDAFQELCRRHEMVIVEGVGGLLVPVGEDTSGIWTCVDLINECSWPVVMVARRLLGTINHTSLTASIPLQAPARYCGLIFCDASPVDSGDVAANESPTLISELLGLPIWGRIPHLDTKNSAALSRAAESLNIQV